MPQNPSEQKVTKSVFKNKNYVLLFAGAFTSNIAATFFNFVVSFLILEITGNNATIQGIYLALCGLTFVIFSIFGGVLADRWNKVKIVYGSDFIKGSLGLVATAIFFFLSENGNLPGQLALLFVIGFFFNVIAAIFQPASSALIPAIVEKDQLQQANSFFMMTNSIVTILGIILAGVLYSAVPFVYIFLAIGILYILSAISELFIKVPYTKNETHLTLKGVFKDFGSGVKTLYSLRAVFFVTMAALFLNFFISPISANWLPYFAKTDLAAVEYPLMEFVTPEMWTAILGVCVSVGSVLMALIRGVTKQNNNFSRPIKFWLGVISLAFISIPILYATALSNMSVFIPLLSVVFLMMGVSIVGVNVPMTVAQQKLVPPDSLAKVNSVISIGSQGLMPLSSLLGGIIIDNFGSLVLLIFSASGITITSLFVIFSKRVSKDL